MKKAKQPIVIGLTGPIASGKSVVASFLARRGGYVIDVDQVGHEVIVAQSKVWKEVIKDFGIKILKRGGVINRKKLAKIVFSDLKALKKLNKISHPAIFKRVLHLISEARRSKKRMIIVDAAMLKEIGLAPRMDRIIVVLASKAKRIKRLLSAGHKMADIMGRMRSQRSDRDYRRGADLVIRNNGPKKRLLNALKGITAKIG